MIPFLSIASYFGAFDPNTYAAETASLAAQGRGQDIVNLFLAAPLLLILLWRLQKPRPIASVLMAGTLFYILYSFVIYAFGIHFNFLFHIYCLVLGLSLYAFILHLHRMHQLDVKHWFQRKVPIRSTSIFLLVIAFLFYYLWLSDTLPAAIAGTTPESVTSYNLLVNPVHVLDMAIALPGLILAAYLLWQHHEWGYILAPMFLVFLIILTIALAAMMIMVKRAGVSEDTSLVYIFLVLAVISFGFLYHFLRHLGPVR